MEMLCVMNEATPRGHLLVAGKQVTARQLASLSGVSVEDCEALLKELEEAGVFSRSDDGAIFSRRMTREIEKEEAAKKNGKEGGNPQIRRGTVRKSERVRPYRRSDSPTKTKRIFERTDGRCYWCDKTLRWEGENGHDLFHVDHLLPVCDGGDNSENNLVAACAQCNHDRKLVTWDHPKDPRPTPTVSQSDTKPHKPEASEAKSEESPLPPCLPKSWKGAYHGRMLELKADGRCKNYPGADAAFDAWCESKPENLTCGDFIAFCVERYAPAERQAKAPPKDWPPWKQEFAKHVGVGTARTVLKGVELESVNGAGVLVCPNGITARNLENNYTSELLVSIQVDRIETRVAQ